MLLTKKPSDASGGFGFLGRRIGWEKYPGRRFLGGEGKNREKLPWFEALPPDREDG
jgi:hypothetical protein